MSCGNSLAVADRDELIRGGKGREDTMIRCHMGGCSCVHEPLLVSWEVHVVEGGQESRVDVLQIAVVRWGRGS
jgi:hypothetical protein